MQIDASYYLAVVALSSILERPFVTCSGVDKNAFRTSVLSNVIASPFWAIFGIIAELSILPNPHYIYGDPFTTFLCAFAFQFVAKTTVVRILARKPINMWSVFAGNCVSVALICIIFVALVLVDEQHPSLWIKMVNYVPLFSMLAYSVFFGILTLIAIRSLPTPLVRSRTSEDTQDSLSERSRDEQLGG